MTRPELAGLAESVAHLTTSDLDDLIDALIQIRDAREPDADLEPEEDADAEDEATAVALMEPEDRRRIAERSSGLEGLDP